MLREKKGIYDKDMPTCHKPHRLPFKVLLEPHWGNPATCHCCPFTIRYALVLRGYMAKQGRTEPRLFPVLDKIIRMMYRFK